MTTRAFVGLPIPDVVQDRLAMLQTGPRGARWVDPVNFHLTLAFIGDVDNRQLADIDAELGAVDVSDFEVWLDGCGFFGSRRPHAFWANVAASMELDHLQSKVETALRRAGAEIEARKFTPHVTLAYVKGVSTDEAERWRAGGALFQEGPIAVDHFHLYASYLGAGGSQYEPLRTYQLSSAR